MRDEHMSGVCLLVALILGILNMGFLRAKRKNWALAVLPLGFVPLVTGIGMIIAEVVFKYDFTFMLPMVLIVTSLVIASIWIGFASGILIKTKRMRIYYLVASVGFVFTFSFIILIKYYNYLDVAQVTVSMR